MPGSDPFIDDTPEGSTQQSAPPDSQSTVGGEPAGGPVQDAVRILSALEQLKITIERDRVIQKTYVGTVKIALPASFPSSPTYGRTVDRQSVDTIMQLMDNGGIQGYKCATSALLTSDWSADELEELRRYLDVGGEIEDTRTWESEAQPVSARLRSSSCRPLLGDLVCRAEELTCLSVPAARARSTLAIPSSAPTVFSPARNSSQRTTAPSEVYRKRTRTFSVSCTTTVSALFSHGRRWVR